MYKIVDDSKVVRISDNKVILPTDIVGTNRDMTAYYDWIKAGNVPVQEHTAQTIEWEIPSETFLSKFTQEEIATALVLRKTDLTVDAALLQLTTYPVVNNKNPLTLQLMDILVSKNIITQTRREEILG